MTMAGTMRHCLTVQRRVDPSSDFSAEEERWVSTGMIWAEVVPLRGRELQESRQIYEQVSHRVTTRWSANLLGSDFRLQRPDGRMLSVEASYSIDGRDQWIEMMASEHG